MKKDLNQIIVVNGIPVTIDTDIFHPLRGIIAAALREAKYTQLPPENWEIKDSEGNLLSPEMTLGQARQSVNPAADDSEKLFLCLRAGTAA